MKNYRPVSNLSFLAKVIERIVSSRIKDHMNNNDLQEKMQSAQKVHVAHSTETALLKEQTDILSYMDKGQGVFLILLDLSAAFGTVDHELLLSFLETHVGLQGPVLSLLKSYLKELTQCVSINCALSEMSELAFGVPQGSVLGPLLFSMYTLPLGSPISSWSRSPFLCG